MNLERAQVTLTSSECKRLIGKAVAQLDEVKNAYSTGMIFLATSTTNAFVAEELLGMKIEEKGMFTAGVTVPGGPCTTLTSKRTALNYKHLVIEKGKIIDRVGYSDIPKVLEKFGKDDVFIKGANAVDPWGVAGIWLGGAPGGTIGHAIGSLMAKGIHLVVPVGLEKLVPYPITDIAPKTGVSTISKSIGMSVGIMPVFGTIVTEIEAFDILSGVEATPIGGGGIGGAEGSRTFVLEGEPESISKAWHISKSIKGEPPLTAEVEGLKIVE
jgi:hypothetical protein